MQNGKGDKLRKGVNLISYRDNFDEIDWSKKEPINEPSSKDEINFDEVKDKQEKQS